MAGTQISYVRRSTLEKDLTSLESRFSTTASFISLGRALHEDVKVVEGIVRGRCKIREELEGI